MAGGLSDILDSLTFESEYLDTFYLNEPRVREQFILNLGAIDSFVRSEGDDTTGGLDVKVIKVEKGRTDDSTVTWRLDAPIAQALVLRAALARRGLMGDLTDRAEKGYRVARGRGYVTGGDYEADYMRDVLDPIENGLYDRFEAERASQEEWRKRIDPQSQGVFTLTVLLVDPPHVCVTFLDGRWLQVGSQHWDWPSEVFGVVRGAIGVAPVISTIHAYTRQR